MSKPNTITFTGIKQGHGSESNSSLWRVAYCEEFKEYFGLVQFGSYAGAWCGIYRISKRDYEAAGTFEDDDYKTERMIRKGKQIYKYENDRNYPEPIDLVLKDKYSKLCKVMQELEYIN